jgi:hypothetical protein
MKKVDRNEISARKGYASELLSAQCPGNLGTKERRITDSVEREAALEIADCVDGESQGQGVDDVGF